LCYETDQNEAPRTAEAPAKARRQAIRDSASTPHCRKQAHWIRAGSLPLDLLSEKQVSSRADSTALLPTPLQERTNP